MCSVIYYVDGDNNPGVGTNGIKYLPEEARVKIFYASNNKYYNKEENKQNLLKAARCEVDFLKVPAGKNAVDMMIGIEASSDLTKNEKMLGVVLVSGDNDLVRIGLFLKERWPDTVIKSVNTIRQGHEIMDLLTISSYEDLHHALILKYGGQVGRETYKRLKSIFIDPAVNANVPALPMLDDQISQDSHVRNRVKKLFGSVIEKVG